MIAKDIFLEKYNIKTQDFEATDLKWEDLKKLYDDYFVFRDSLESSATYIFSSLMKARKVHSVRYRIKDPEHVIEKIIRRKIEDKKSNFTIENYKEEMTDLIGIRALHLFKEDWSSIDDFIKQTWNLKQPPVANFRKGDAEQLINIYKEKGCEPKEHKFGYRSVHYIIETQPAKQKHVVEIQVRTIFEEAWSEIDHTVRYPYDLDNPIFSQFLSILNRLAGGADEMGSFIKFLQKELAGRELEFNAQLDQKDKSITELEKKIEKFNLNAEELKTVKEDLEKLRKQQVFNPSRTTGKSLLDFFKEAQGNDSIKRLNESLKNYERITKPPSSIIEMINKSAKKK